MKNIILLTHGEMSKGVAQSLRFIAGEIENLKTISINLDDSIEVSHQQLIDAIELFDNTYPTVIVTDIPGGSTTQIALKALVKKEDIYLITGLNLALVLQLSFLKLTDSRKENLKLLQDVVEEAKASINVITCDDSDNLLDEDGEL
ncbi:MAG: hypothetical protein MR210_04385 [Erysipelotrichaceae bacterium]|nr:hypothetical protein [Erysipelotrichaceae bacterium]MDY5252749.1 hypothetical protein [Erysipelotrichaceae bacterium]